MIMKTNKETKKTNNIINGKRGFTLVEVCVVLMIVSIITVMVVSFSVLVENHSNDQLSDFEFLEDCTDLKAEINAWVREYDTAGARFFISEGKLCVESGGTELEFAQSLELEEIKALSFAFLNDEDKNLKMIKCNAYRTENANGNADFSCSFALRIAEIETQGENDFVSAASLEFANSFLQKATDFPYNSSSEQQKEEIIR